MFNQAKRKSWSLRNLLILPFVLQIGATVTLVAYLSWRTSQKAVEEMVGELNTNISNQINERLRIYLSTSHQNNQTNAELFRRKIIDPFNQGKIEKYFWAQLKNSQSTGFIAFGDYRGQYTEVLRQDDGTFVAKVKTEKGSDRLTYQLDQNGNRTKKIASRPNYDPRERPFYQTAIESGKPAWTEVYLWFGSDNFSIDAVKPLFDSKNQVLGVLDSGASLTNLSKFLAELKIGKTGQAFILEASGYLIATSNQEQPFLTKLNSKEKQRLKASESRNLVLVNTYNYLSDYSANLANINQPISSKISINNQAYFVRVIPYQDQYGLDWLTVVVIPELDYATEINQNILLTAILCIAALILAIAMGVITARWIVQPILDLNQAAKALANNQWNTQVESDRITEVKELERSFNSMAMQLQELVLALEARVEQRTTELAAANQHILQLNESLKQENSRMSSELDVIRRLQAMILPKTNELQLIKGLEIDGLMEPADEVGGDYYDVLSQNDAIKIGIGDITGHGLESAVIMIMVQTAVRTLLETNQTDPVQFLSVLNRVIYANIIRMDSAKNLSLAILDYKNGKLLISGQHEEAIIIRSGGTIERIDTGDLGFPVGLEPDISCFVNQIKIDFNQGDTVVLYTDGITEAENIERQFYGLERLCTVLSQNWQHPPSKIRAAVVEDLRSHIGGQKIYDDITLVVFRQNLI